MSNKEQEQLPPASNSAPATENSAAASGADSDSASLASGAAAAADTASDEENIIARRRRELAGLRSGGWNYPNDFRVSHSAAKLHSDFGQHTNDELEQQDLEYSLAGRIMLKRDMGKTCFVTLQDSSGRMQIYARLDNLGEDEYNKIKSWDLGDLVGVTGALFRTKSGELSIKAQQAILLAKCLRPLPDKYHGLSDTELRYRRRYLDLLLNPASAELFKLRSSLVLSIRQFFNEHGFLEVETPMMHAVAGGALAKPFETFHNALGLKMFLRVAPELFLKRLLVGGFDKVFEVNRNFRNEGLSTKHNPEFTMLEFYQAFANYEDFMALIEKLLKFLAQRHQPQIKLHSETIDLTQGARRLTHQDAVLQYNPGLSSKDYADEAALKNYAQDLGVKLESGWGLGKLQNEVFEKTVEAKLIQPTFVTQYPTAVSPLSRRNDEDASIADRFELFIGGAELANGFSELNDPEEQARVFRQQALAKQAGDEEAMHYDEDYITALEYAMPPAAGAGIGIDRLVMLFTNSSSIRDVVLFPTLRPSIN